MLNLLRSYRRPSRSSRRSRAGVLLGEALESRTMLAGNVAATMVGGDLSLEGDAESNSVEVTIENGDLVVRGLDDTMINGSSDEFVVISGGDTIDGNLTARLGKGSDTIRLSGPMTVRGDVRMADRSGNNQVGITNTTIEGSVQLRTARGSDTVSLVSATIGGDLRIRAGRGTNLVSVLNSTVTARVDVRTGNGLDQIALDGVMIGDIHLHTGSGVDRIVITESTIDGSLHASTGGGRDFLQIDESTINGDTALWMWGASDMIVTQGTVMFGGDFWAGGILGRSDTIELSDATTFTGKQRVAFFEVQGVDDLTDVNNTVSDVLAVALDAQVLLNGVDIGDLTLTVDTSGNTDVVESNNTLVTKSDMFLIEGTTLARATVNVAAGPNGSIDLGSVVAGDDGTYSIEVDLLNGGTTVMVTATDILDRMLTESFNLHKAVGTVVRFDSSEGSFDVELFDDDAPQTVANFLNYSDRYVDSIVHRSAVTATNDPFVIQGGGFSLGTNDDLQEVVTDPPVPSEFTGVNSNIRGTIAMALSAGNPDSGTSQWFVNLTDNSFLDGQQFTVFGNVIGDGMDVADAIAALERVDLNDIVPLMTTALNEVPLDGYTPDQIPLTGTVSVMADSVEVIGTGTLFTSELMLDDVIEIEGNKFRVISIDSDTQLTVDSSRPVAVTDAAFSITRVPIREEYVVMNSISVIL